MTKRNLFSRVGIPIAVVMIPMIISVNAYDFVRTVESKGLHQFLANLTAMVMFLTIWLGALIANPISYFMGASFKERILVSIATPVVQAIKIVYGYIGIYSTGETFFLFLHSFVFGLILITLFFMGISELFCRTIKTKCCIYIN